MVRYGKAIMPHKYPMNFLLIVNLWTTTFFLTLNTTTKFHYGCSVCVEKEGIQMVEQTIGSVWMIC